MLNGITDCHMKLREFAALFHGLAKMLEDMIPPFAFEILGGETLEAYLRENSTKDLMDKMMDIAVDKTKSNLIANFFANDTRAWINHTRTNRRLMICINKARVN